MPRTSSGHDGQFRSARSAKAALREWQDTIAAARLCNARGACHNGSPAGDPRESARPSLAARASRAADPDPVAGADGRSWHRPLRLFAGAAGHARRARLVVFRRGLHEHGQRGRLSRRRADRLKTDQALRTVRHGALGDAGLRGVAGAVRDLGQFPCAQFCAAAGGAGCGGRIRRRRGTGGDDRAIASRAGEFSAELVLCRSRARHRGIRADRALRAAGVRTGIVVDRLVGDDAARGRHDRCRCCWRRSTSMPASPKRHLPDSRSGRC